MFCVLENIIKMCIFATQRTQMMSIDKMIPSEPVHPGLLLKEEIEYRGITQKALAKQMGVSYTVLNKFSTASVPFLWSMPCIWRLFWVLKLSFGYKCRQIITSNWLKVIRR